MTDAVSSRNKIIRCHQRATKEALAALKPDIADALRVNRLAAALSYTLEAIEVLSEESFAHSIAIEILDEDHVARHGRGYKRLPRRAGRKKVSQT